MLKGKLFLQTQNSWVKRNGKKENHSLVRDTESRTSTKVETSYHGEDQRTPRGISC